MKQYINYFWNTKWVLILTASILLGLSYPPFPLPFLIFPAFLLVFRLINLSNSAREAAYLTYPAFVIWNLITTYWLMMATLAGGIAAILANSAVMTIPVMLQYKIQQQKLKPWLIAFLQSAFWLGYEYLHHQWDLAWPWLTLANAWANAPLLVQYISITGYWGTSFWVIFTSALAYQAIKNYKQSTVITALTVLFIFPVFSMVKLALEPEPKPETSLEVIVVQPNFNSYQTYGGFLSSYRATQHLLQLSDSLRTSETQLIVWPENAIQSYMSSLDSYSDIASDTQMLLNIKADDWDATLIAGATYVQFYDTGKAPVLPYSSDNGSFLPFNAALGFLPDQPMEIYRKHNLVPIVERIPFVQLLNTVDIFNWVNWSRYQGYGQGLETNQFPVADTKTPALICYDSVFPNWTRTFVKRGAGFLTIITNDGWWGNTSGHAQHFAYARLRAIETNRWIVRSANNGISGIIAPDGAVKVKTDYGKATAFRYAVPVITSQTFYTRYGDWLPIGMLVITFLGVGFIGVKEYWKS
ncbi:MAG TPA: apolipoprotein N-acyltransferase [Balneolaceae bacterium]